MTASVKSAPRMSPASAMVWENAVPCATALVSFASFRFVPSNEAAVTSAPVKSASSQSDLKKRAPRSFAFLKFVPTASAPLKSLLDSAWPAKSWPARWPVLDDPAAPPRRRYVVYTATIRVAAASLRCLYRDGLVAAAIIRPPRRSLRCLYRDDPRRRRVDAFATVAYRRRDDPFSTATIRVVAAASRRRVRERRSASPPRRRRDLRAARALALDGGARVVLAAAADGERRRRREREAAERYASADWTRARDLPHRCGAGEERCEERYAAAQHVGAMAGSGLKFAVRCVQALSAAQN